MRGEFPPDEPARTVKPRTSSATWRPIIALGARELLLERTGEVFPAAAFPMVLAAQPSSIIAVQGFGPHLIALRDRFGNDPRFNYRITPHYHDSRRGDGTPSRQTRVHDALVNFVGWKDERIGKGRNSARAVYHYPLDPVVFVRCSIDELIPDIDMGRVEKLLAWSQKVRDWCVSQSLELKPSSGGLVAQLLRDSRFCNEPRRKVPRVINDTARSRLPGNYYLLRATIGERYNALYLDQTNAHHFAAARIQFPDPNTLHAYGRFTEIPRPDSGNDRLPAEPSGRRDRLFDTGESALLQRPGLFLLRVSSGGMGGNRFPPPWLRFNGTRDVWAYSNELDLIRQEGARIVGVVAALVADDTSDLLNRYARFAIGEIAAHPEEKRWLKPTLHSTYGLLAGRPLPFETGFHRAKTGTPVEYPMGPVSVPALAHRSRKAVESRVANVIWRGMIEAEVRKESLWFAQYLAEVERRRVLAVYADSVFVSDDGRPLKFLQPPWRVAEYCDGLRFLSPTHFESAQLTRLPGISRQTSDEDRLNRLIRRELLISSIRQTKRPQEGSNGTQHQAGRFGQRHGRGPRRDPDGTGGAAARQGMVAPGGVRHVGQVPEGEPDDAPPAGGARGSL